MVLIPIRSFCRFWLLYKRNRSLNSSRFGFTVSRESLTSAHTWVMRFLALYSSAILGGGELVRVERINWV